MTDTTDAKPIDHMAGKWLRYMELRTNIKELEKQANKLERELRSEVGTAQRATIFGEVVLTYEPVDRMRVSALAEDNPDLYQEYVTPKVVDQFDVDRFRAEHPGLYVQYQSRQWRPKDA